MRGSQSHCRKGEEPDNFNSRLYMRGSTMDGDELDAILISIHASTWEAAKKPVALPTKQTHFNSRLYMRGSRSPLRWAAIRPYFNSRLYMRGSRVREYDDGTIKYISIHASTWEAALCNFASQKHNQYFNSRLYMRGSITYEVTLFVVVLFQFTPLHERQRILYSASIHNHISIHASTWEAAYTCSLT